MGLGGLDGLTHSLFWSLLANVGAYVAVSLRRTPSAQETSQALLFVDVFQRTRRAAGRCSGAVAPRYTSCCRWWAASSARSRRGRCSRIMRAQSAWRASRQIPPDARLVQFVETQLAGAIGSASARVMVASVVEEEALGLDDVMRILDEASQLRAYSRELEDKSRSLERATAELRAANEQLKSLDRLKDDFMSSVTHELRTPLTSIRALSRTDGRRPRDGAEQRQQFLRIVVAETER